MGIVNPTPPPLTIAFALDRHGMQQLAAIGLVMRWLTDVFCHDPREGPEYK
jgi:hypothetical protein